MHAGMVATVHETRCVSIARGLLATMLATGATPDLESGEVARRAYAGNTFGVQVRCTLYELPPHEWADVALEGAPFGPRGVQGRAWNEAAPGAPRKVTLERGLERALRNRGVRLLAVYALPSDPLDTLMVELHLPIMGKQSVVLRGV